MRRARGWEGPFPGTAGVRTRPLATNFKKQQRVFFFFFSGPCPCGSPRRGARWQRLSLQLARLGDPPGGALEGTLNDLAAEILLA